MAERHDDDGAEKASVNERDEEKERVIDRRDYLKFTGSATVAAGLAAGGASAAVTRHGISFDRVVDAIDDLGMDPSGGEAIDGKLSNVEPNTLVEFPNGEYKINGGFWFREDDASYGMVGVGDDVRIKPPNGTNDYLIHAFCGEFLFENIDVDIRADNTVGGFRIYPHQGFHVQDVEWLGRGWNGDFDQSGTVHAYMAGVQSSGGVGIFRNVVHKKISLFGDAYPSGGADRRGRAGIWAGGNHKGIIRLENCDFREARNNGLYMSRTPGYVQIENCYFENNNVSSIRISGEKSYVKNTKVVCDASRFSDTGDLSRDGINIRGLICEQKRFWSKPGPLTVEDTVFEWRSLPPGVNSGGVVNLGPAGRTLRLNNVDVKVDTNNTIALKRRSPNDLGYTPDKPWWIRADNLTITGSGSGGRTVLLWEADGSWIRDSCISQSGSNRDGVVLRGSDSCVIENTAIDVSGQAITLNNSSADTNNISEEAQCQHDGSTGGGSGGDDGSDDGSSLPNLLTVDGDGQDASYQFSVDGDLQRSEENGATIDAGDTVEGSTATGDVTDSADSYRFGGEITDFSLDGPATVTLNGREVNPDALALPNVMTIVGDQGEANYEFTIGGDLAHSTDDGATIDPADEVDGSTASGFVHGGKDSYRFDGEITDFSLDAPATVLVDGQEVDPVTFSLPNVLTIVGDQGPADYELTVSGDLQASTANGASVDDSDEVDGSTASGFVHGGKDSYEFTGDIVAFDLSAPATVTLDGEEVDPASLAPESVITVFGDQGPANYEFSVSGEVIEKSTANGATKDDTDEVDGSTASGFVHGGKDSYRFTGSITAFNTDAPVSITFDGEAVDASELGTDTPHQLVIEGGTPESPTTYKIRVSGNLRKGRQANDSDEVQSVDDASVATGKVEDGADDFWFSGDVTQLNVTGDADVIFDKLA